MNQTTAAAALEREVSGQTAGDSRAEEVDPVFAGIGQQIRTARKRRRLTLEEAAAAVGLTTGYLSQIERGLAAPTLAALKRIADGLGVGLGDLFPRDDSEPPYGLVRREERPKFHHPVSGHVYQQLTPTWGGRMHAALYALAPGEQTERLSHSGDEFAFVLEGEIEYRVGHRQYRMVAGDSLYFDCFQTHSVVNVGDGHARWIWVSTPAP